MITPDQSKKAIDKARKAGIDLIVGSFIVGAPRETKNDIQKTFDFIKKLNLDVPQINVLGASPGTPIWEELKSEGVLNEDMHWETGIGVAEVYPTSVSLCEINKMISDFYRDYVRSPKFILKQLMLTIKSPYRLNVISNNLVRIGDINDSVSNYMSR